MNMKWKDLVNIYAGQIPKNKIAILALIAVLLFANAILPTDPGTPDPSPDPTPN